MKRTMDSLATQVPSILESHELAWDAIQRLGLDGGAKSGGKVVGVPMTMQTGAVRAFQLACTSSGRGYRIILVKYESTDRKE